MLFALHTASNIERRTGSSTELRAQQQPLEYVSPMILNYLEPPTENYPEAMTPMPSSMNPQYTIPPRGAASAPAHIVFRTNSSTDIDIDISPLTSPWLGAQQHHPSYVQRNKRTASSSGDEASSKPSKKKQSPAIRPYNPAAAPKRATRTSKSTTSTPILRSARSRNEILDDSPSPVDLSMPPPASTSSHSVMTMPPPDSTAFPSPSLTPVTPASIMNLGRLGVNNTNNLAPVKFQDKGKAPAKPSISTGTLPQRSKTTRRASIGASPALKPILPGLYPQLTLPFHWRLTRCFQLELPMHPCGTLVLYQCHKSARHRIKQRSRSDAILSRRHLMSFACSFHPYLFHPIAGFTTNPSSLARFHHEDHRKRVATVPIRLSASYNCSCAVTTLYDS